MFVRERLGSSSQGKWTLRVETSSLSATTFRFAFNDQVAVAKVGGPKIDFSLERPKGELSVEDVEETMCGFATLPCSESNRHGEIAVSVPMVDSRSRAVVGEVVLVLEYPATSPHRRLFTAALRRVLDGPPSVLAACMTLPFWFFTLCTSVGWWFRQWLLVLPGYLYLSPWVPTALGWALGKLVTRWVLFGYSGGFVCEALHVSWWISSRGNLHWRVTARNVGLGNPPGYPLEHFVHCKLLDVAGSLPLAHVRDFLLQRYKPSALAKVPDLKFLAKVHIEYVDVDGFFIDLHLHDGVLNLVEINRQLAQAEVQSVHKGQKMPNQLEVRIIRAVDLAKAARGSVRSRTAKPSDSRPWGKNATLDAFMEDEDEDGDVVQVKCEEDDSSESAFDPFVLVTLRQDSQTTKTQPQTNLPMFDETLYFPVTDAATVVLVQVFARHAAKSDELLGQWSITLKDLLSNPAHCWYERGTLEASGDGMIKGWFPLVNSQLTGRGMCGKIEMSLHWKHVAELVREFSPPTLGGLGQLLQASSEFTLRVDDFETFKREFTHMPVLLLLDRMSLRNTKAYIKDLFVSNDDDDNTEEEATDELGLPFAKVPQIDWQDEFKPQSGDPGLTVFELLKRVAVGLGPKILDLYRSKANLGSTVASIVGPAISDQVAQGAHHLAKGEAFGPFRTINRGAKRLAKSLANSFEVVTHMRTTQHAEDAFKTPVDALDQDFVSGEVVLAGHLERSAVGLEDANNPQLARAFSKHYFELKGQTLFYREPQDRPDTTATTDDDASVYATTWYKIPLASVQSLACFPDELVLTHGDDDDDDDCVTRLRQVDAEEPSLASWLAALQPRLASGVVVKGS